MSTAVLTSGLSPKLSKVRTLPLSPMDPAHSLTLSSSSPDARESIYILDWWLSPEIYLRRPPAANERYRLDNMLKAAAERGVKVSIIVYREVEAALTCK